MSSKLRFALLAILAFSAIEPMQLEDFMVAVFNHYGAQLEVHYILDGKELVHTISPNRIHIIGKIQKLSGEVKIYRSGAVVGHFAAGQVIPTAALEQVWAQKRQPGKDALLLDVSSQPGKIVIQYQATTAASLEIRVKTDIGGGVLDQFPDLAKYDLQKTLTPERIVAIKSWKEEVVPAGWVSRATTGEDIARYILGLPPKYNAESVQKAYTTLALKWHPDKQKIPGMKDFAQQVMPLIIHAKELLQEALRDKVQVQ